MMDRKALLAILASQVTNEIVVSTYSTATDWFNTADRPLNYFSHGAMGLASSHGLGLALARPERKTIVLDGDGSLLMNLGTLVTLGAAAPKNYLYFLLQNGTYEANGGHLLPSQSIDFCGLARSSGLKQVSEIRSLIDFEAKLPGLLANDGPAFVNLFIKEGGPTKHFFEKLYKPERRAALREALGKASGG